MSNGLTTTQITYIVSAFGSFAVFTTGLYALQSLSFTWSQQLPKIMNAQAGSSRSRSLVQIPEEEISRPKGKVPSLSEEVATLKKSVLQLTAASIAADTSIKMLTDENTRMRNSLAALERHIGLPPRLENSVLKQSVKSEYLGSAAIIGNTLEKLPVYPRGN